MRRPRLLFLCQTLPFPPDGGVAIRSFHTLRLLARRFDVTALCFYRWKRGAVRGQIDGSVKALSAYAHVEAFAIPQEHSRARLLSDHLRSIVTGRPYTVFAYESTAFRHRLTELLRAEPFDLVHVDSLDLSGYLPALPLERVAVTHHNVESALLRRRSALESRAAVSAYMRRQADLLEREERHWCPRVALNLTVSEADAEVLSELAPSANVAVVPNGVDTETFYPGATRSSGGDAELPSGGLVFVGGTTWFPNRDALAYFVGQILPALRRRGVAAPVTWVGRATDAEIARYSGVDGLTLTGYVDDVRPYLDAAHCFVVPLRVGGGTRLKILDAWAMGKGVVSTSVGCEGLAARNGDNILIGDSVDDFADAVASVLGDAALRARLEAGARRTAEELYGWDAIGRTLEAHYAALIGRPGESVAHAEPAAAAGVRD